MPFALVTIGLLLIVVGFQNTYQAFGEQVIKDFSKDEEKGTESFLWWMAAIGFVGALGYAKSLENFSRAFMALIIIGMILANKGFFDKFSTAFAEGVSTDTNPVGAPLPSSGGGGGGGGGFGLGDAIGLGASLGGLF